MFTVIEFMGCDDESAGEVAIVPISWLQKHETKCYWPINTKRRSFSDFVKDETPYKTSWPCYKVFKVHRKSVSYSDAEVALENIINALQSDSNTSVASAKSLTRKVPDKLVIDTSSSSSESDHHKTKKLEVRRNLSSSSDSDDSLISSKPKMKKPKKTVMNQEDKNSAAISQVNIQEKAENKLLNLSTASTDTVYGSEAGSLSSWDRSFEEVAKNLSSIKSILDQHSIALNMLQRHAQLSNRGSIVAPQNLSDLPLKNYEAFKEFEELLKNDEAVHAYMTNRLAAVGGSGLEGLTRRMLKLIMTDTLAMEFNWKGREKRCFEETNLMKIIYNAAKMNFPYTERNDLLIENSVKDWLKNAKTRTMRKKPKT